MSKTIDKPVACIFCASSAEISESIKSAGQSLAQLLAENNFGLLYGGTNKGYMRMVADAYKASPSGNMLIGVIPKYMVKEGLKHPNLDTIHIVNDIRDRKQIMLEKSDYIVVLPGGIGTFDEFFDLLTLKSLKRHNKPMFMLNTSGFYDTMMAVFRQGIAEKTIKSTTLSLFHIVSTPQELLSKIKEEQKLL